MKTALKSKGTAVIKAMPNDLKDKLNGLTINEAIERGFITDLGNEAGEFMFEHADANIDATYAVVNGYGVPCSKGLADAIDSTDDIMGDLVFQKGISNIEGDGFGKEWFRLGMPQGIRLGDSVKSLALEPAETA